MLRHLVFGLLFVCSSSVAQPLKSGDLLFVSSAASDFEQAIAEVTNDELQRNFSHIGMANVTDSGVYVIEAAPKLGVVYRPVAEFEQDNIKKLIFVSRLKPQYQHWIPGAIIHAYSHLGKPYDYAFDFDNDDYYCSELIYVAFAQASGKTDVFETPPMTFKLSKDADFSPYWVDYFAKQDMLIPEGKPGINPNGISRSDKLEPLIEFVETHSRASLQLK
ncbi:MAG: hypothetical protein FWE63_05705 [Bacteroidales bacterium]|nr:hypothetical protein [Bacteroidales bacterium]